MRALASPAIHLMNRLKYPQKFLLISMLFAIPLLIVLTQFLVNLEADVRFSAEERIGLEYNAPLIHLLALVQRHAALISAARSGVPNLDPELTATQQAIATQVQRVEAINAELGDRLKVSQDWEQVREALPTLETTSEQHLAISSAILALITQVGNNSNLILDPDIDSYYLMNSVITTLPLTTEYFSQLRTYGVAAIAQGALSDSDQTRLTILAGLAASALEANMRSYRYTFDFNSTVAAQLSPESDANYAALSALLDLIRQTFDDLPASNLSAAEYLDQSTRAIDGSFALYSQVAAELDRLLDIRISSMVNNRAVILSITALTLAATVYIFIGFYLSVQKTISAMQSAADSIVNRDMPGDLVLESRDELAKAAVAFNNVAKNLDLARREAVEATRMKDLFLATMSHELRTPLNAMIGFVTLMLYSGQLNEDNTHMAERAFANTQRLLTLINNILDISRIATGGMDIVPGAVSLRDIAAGLFNDLKPQADEKSLRLELVYDDQIPKTINHDETRLTQIVTNLVSNAIKFTEKGTITMGFRRRDDQLIIQVSDTGIGIPQSKQHLVFDDFFQVDGSSTRKQQGAGLGLAIVKRLVLLMRGTISVSSEVDKGSTFTVEIPLDLPPYETNTPINRLDQVFVDRLNAPGSAR